MTHPGSGAGGAGGSDAGGSDAGGSDAGIRAAAIDVADYLLKLELPDDRWDRIAGILAVAAEAAAAGDAQGVRAATTDLKLFGPVRIIRIGASPVGPPPPRVRERVEQVRAAVTAMAPASGEGDGQEADDDR